VINSIEELITIDYGVGIPNGQEDEESNAKIEDATKYLRLDYIDRIRYITEEVPEITENAEYTTDGTPHIEKKKDNQESKEGNSEDSEVRPEEAIANSRIYTESALDNVLRRTNNYIDILRSKTF
jgi:hypothetical protein